MSAEPESGKNPQVDADLRRAKEALERQAHELFEGSERLRLALSAGHLGDWRWDAADDMVYLSARASEIFGLPAGERITWTTMRGMLHRDDAERARLAVEKAVAERSDYDIEYRVTRPSGEECWIAAKGRGTYDARDAVTGMIGIVQDITERRRADEALLEAQARLAMAMESGQMGTWEWVVATGKVTWSPMLERIHGLRTGSFRGSFEHFQHDIHPDDRERVLAAIGASLGTGADYRMEYRIVKPDGSVAWIEARGKVILDGAGQPERMLGLCMDATLRMQAQEMLREETRVLELLNRTGATLSAKLDLQSLLQAVTDAGTELTGARFGAFFYNMTDDNGDVLMLYTLSGAPREAFEKFGHPRATPLFGPTFRGEGIIRIDDVLEDPRYGKWGPHHGMPPGHLPVRSYLAVPVSLRSGEVVGGLFFGHPEPGMFDARAERLISGIAAQAAVAVDNARLYEASRRLAAERETLLGSERQARADAERMSEMKDEFLANLSHELRTPLNAIVGWTQILRHGANNPADMARGLDTIERNARVQTQLIEDLLDMSRIASGKVRLDIQPIEPVAFIEAAIESLKPAADARSIRLQKILDLAAGPISGDPNRLQQVIWNLLSNAIKFTPKGGKIQVLLERVNSHIEISVADTGAGIEPQFLPHVFERFRQGDASTTRKFGGLGLGLSIVKSLVEMHGGLVRVQSPGKDQGTTFTVHLPVTVVHRPESGEARVHPRSPSGASADFRIMDLTGVRVVVVDDELDARELIKRVLTDCQAEVSTAGTADEALQLVEAQRPDVFISDIGMPDVDGYELLRRVRALGAERGGRVPAIALTAFARSEDRTRALRAGFMVHVSKPVEPSELVATVASVSGHHGR
jgi:PAS domain S-box-containing protein